MLPKNWKKLTTKQKLTLITLLGGLLRVAFIGSYPSKLNVDEAAKGYNALSLITTGKTFRGLTWPLYFTDFDEDQPSTAIIYNYLVVPSVAIFGLTKAAVRLPAAILGTLTIPALYYLTYLMYKNKNTALLAALFLCLSPWHIFLSRWGIEPITYPAFFITSFALLMKGLNSGAWRVLGSFLLGLTMYTYPVALLITPIFFMGFIYATKTFWLRNLKYSLLSLGAYFLAIAPLIYLYSTNTLMYGRFNTVSVFTSFGTWKALGIFIAQMFGTFAHLIMLYPLILVIYFIRGFLNLTGKSSPNKMGRLLVILYLLSIVPANLTLAADHILVLFFRGISMIGLVEMMAAYYLTYKRVNLGSLNNKLLFTLLIINWLFLFYLYHLTYGERKGGYRELGYEKAYEYTINIDKNYKNVIVDVPENQAFIYLLFYYKYPPSLFLTQNPVWIKTNNSKVQTLTNFGKYYFCNGGDCPTLTGNILVVTLPNRHTDLKEIQAIYKNSEKILSIREKRN